MLAVDEGGGERPRGVWGAALLLVCLSFTVIIGKGTTTNGATPPLPVRVLWSCCVCVPRVLIPCRRSRLSVFLLRMIDNSEPACVICVGIIKFVSPVYVPRVVRPVEPVRGRFREERLYIRRGNI